ncbi:hypothetical protein ASPBRDRAFT_27091 [Aspergillus brasiliensis CBS 101740]|uniref:Uncharacterized protein n=1 Tax=Aspergillus brasiliensis (strain CBS 101740 / IMI 381727 / IBT 21946) TaxID=767769 RepID=A0A1L9UY85_ASPBC|nr:hypothetical protein ASPBRDRAFT_27091 [Aspergillus brasiliensis CBS 101740]
MASSTARLQVWSASDRDGITRIQEAWKLLFTNIPVTSKGRSSYLDCLSHTLSSTRTWLEWRAYTVAEPDSDWEAIPGRMLTYSLGKTLNVYARRTHTCKLWDANGLYWTSEAEPSVNLTDHSQTSYTVLQVALVDLLKQFEIISKKVVGHLPDEIAAVYGPNPPD